MFFDRIGRAPPVAIVWPGLILAGFVYPTFSRGVLGLRQAVLSLEKAAWSLRQDRTSPLFRVDERTTITSGPPTCWSQAYSSQPLKPAFVAFQTIAAGLPLLTWHTNIASSMKNH